MDFPQLPTDNFYKFLSVLGIFFALSMYTFINIRTESGMRTVLEHRDAKEISQKLVYIQEFNAFKNQLGLGDGDQEVGGFSSIVKKVDCTIDLYRKGDLMFRGIESKYRDSSKVTWSMFVLKEKRTLTKENSLTLDSLNSMSRRSAQFQTELLLNRIKEDRGYNQYEWMIKRLRSYGLSGMIVSLLAMIFWYVKFQRYQDRDARQLNIKNKLGQGG
jgi:hypothetical protein